METEEVIWGRNAVLEALRGPRGVRRLVVANGVHFAGAMAEALAEAREQHVPVQRVPREALDRISGTQHHQGIAAVANTYAYAE
ncbi:MAG: RNA methyltransferase substrate-binding domain-containing protein, partial [Chloroflexota bacterium]